MIQTGEKMAFKLLKATVSGALRISRLELPDVSVHTADGRCYFLFRKTYIS